MKLKTILLVENVDDWNGITEHDKWFCYRESNNWDTKRSGASVYITEGEPHKYWVKIKTHGLRKPTDTNESYRKRVKKHADKVARTWMSIARKIHNNPEINEVGNEIQISWKDAFRKALDELAESGMISEWGEEPRKKPGVDSVNFTNVLQEASKKKKDISYCGVVLDNKSHNKLISTFRTQLPDSWKKIAHHMTIKLGELPSNLKKDLGKKVTLTVTELGKSDKAIAVKVKGYHSDNKIPHVTLAVNVNGGGEPVHSNDIKEWEKVKNLTITGTVQELED